MIGNGQNINTTRIVGSVRAAMGWTPAEMARAWGVLPGFVTLAEDGGGVSQRQLGQLAKVLDIPVSFLYVLAEDPSQKVVGPLQNMILDFLTRKAEEEASS
jgi:hypothetical protein